LSEKRVWLVTGAGRGMGADFVREARAAGDLVVAAGRNTDHLKAVFDDGPDLLIAKLDVTRPADAERTVDQAVERFGRIDILVNNAGISYKGYFEEMTLDQIHQQLEVNLFGPMIVTRAVLPVMRRQRSGHIISISSGAGIMGFEFSSAYATSKFGLEGWMDVLRQEVQPFGIATTIVNPGFFRTDLISEKSMFFVEPTIKDYDDRRKVQMEWWPAQAGKQPGNPKKLAKALVELTRMTPPPVRFAAGVDAIRLAERKIETLRAEIEANRRISEDMGFDE